MSKIKYVILFVSLACLGLAACDNKDDMDIFYGTHYATGMLKNGEPISDGGDSIKDARIRFYKNNTISIPFIYRYIHLERFKFGIYRKLVYKSKGKNKFY